MVIAAGSYPAGRWFESDRRYQNNGSLVKRSRHRPFTAVTGVRFPQESPYGELAQLGEHLPYKQRVTGSSPVLPTNKSRSKERDFFIFSRHYAKRQLKPPIVHLNPQMWWQANKSRILCNHFYEHVDMLKFQFVTHVPAFCRFLAKQQALAFTRACLIGFANGVIANNSVLPTKHSTNILSSSSKFFLRKYWTKQQKNGTKVKEIRVFLL